MGLAPCMEWLTFIIIEGGVVVLLVLIRMTLGARRETAHEWLKKGAKVVDVRSEGQFKEKHLPGAVSISLHRLRDLKIRVAPRNNSRFYCTASAGRGAVMGKVHAKEIGLSLRVQPRLVRASGENPWGAEWGWEWEGDYAMRRLEPPFVIQRASGPEPECASPACARLHTPRHGVCILHASCMFDLQPLLAYTPPSHYENLSV